MLNILTDYWFWGSAGLMIGSVPCIRKMAKNGCSFPIAVISMTVGIYFGMLGTRILWISIYCPELFYQNLPLALAFWQQTGSWLAAPPLGGLAIAIVLKIARKPVWTNLGCIAVGLALAHAITRIGCLCAGCCHGKPSAVPWAIYSQELNAMVHPTQIYSIAGEITSFIILWLLWRNLDYRKYLYPLYVLILSVHRFISEFFRGDYPGPEIFPHLRIYQSICIFLFVISLAVILILKWKKNAVAIAILLITTTIVTAAILKPASEKRLAKLRAGARLYLVVTRSVFVSELRVWKQQRTKDGFNVIIKDFEQAPSRQQISSWIEKQVNANEGLCSYILIVGDCAKENTSELLWHIPSVKRHVRFLSNNNREFYTDVLFGDLDNDGCPDVPVGRIPVRNSVELKAQIRKIITLERQRPQPDWYRTVIWQGAEGYTSSMQQITSYFAKILPEWLDTYIISGQTSSVHSGYPPDQPVLFLEQFNRPVMLSLIASHGSFRSVTPTVYNGEKIFLSVDDLAGAVFNQPSGVLFMLGCDSGRFYTSDEKGISLAEAFLNTSGGPVGIFASTEATNPLTNYFVSREMVEHLKDRHQTAGNLILAIQRSLYRKGKQSILQLAQADSLAKLLVEAVPEDEKHILEIPEAIRNEIIRYTLLGDPSIRLKLPKELSFTVDESDNDSTVFTAQTPGKCTEFYVQAIKTAKPSFTFQSNTTKEQRRSAFKVLEPRPKTILKKAPNSKIWQFTISPRVQIDEDIRLRFIAVTQNDTHIGTYESQKPHTSRNFESFSCEVYVRNSL
ncbi:MAG: prolipoprotein diacylglyceryl transferase family protein [Planctomycetota bacterium]